MGVVRIVTDIPGPRSRALEDRRKKVVVDAHSSVAPIFVASANGCRITDVDGNIFIDFAGGIGSMNAGHQNPSILKGIEQQIEEFSHLCFTVTPYEPYVSLAEKLNQITPGSFQKKTLLINSGAEAVENAVKVARYYTKRKGIVVFEHAFHGRSLLTMTMTHREMPYKYGFGPFAPEIYRLPFPYKNGTDDGSQFIGDLYDFFSSTSPGAIAAFVIELVAGEGGFLPANQQFVNELIKVCKNYGIVLVVDEVQTGFGRTGKFFACEWYDLEPDIIIMAKSLGGGLPLGAVTGRAEIMDCVHSGGLGGTFGGNPLACQAALGTIDVLEGLIEEGRARELARIIPDRFNAIMEKSPCVSDARGIGCMYALEICDGSVDKNPSKEKTDELLFNCLQEGLIMIPSGTNSNVIRTLMPLTLSDVELEEGLAIIESNMDRLS